MPRWRRRPDFEADAGVPYRPSYNADPAIPVQCWVETGYGTQNACKYCHTMGVELPEPGDEENLRWVRTPNWPEAFWSAPSEADSSE